MKSIAELEAIRLKTLGQVNLRRDHEGTRIIVGMGTCGIAAGARAVVAALMDEISKLGLLNIVVAQAAEDDGDKAPVVKVTCPGKEIVTYENVKPEMAAAIVNDAVNG